MSIQNIIKEHEGYIFEKNCLKEIEKIKQEQARQSRELVELRCKLDKNILKILNTKKAT